MNSLGTRHSGLLDRKYREFFVPTILMAMTTTMSIVVDSIIVGNLLGANALASVNLVLPLVMAYTTVAVLLGFGGATIISVALGRRQEAYANELFTTSIIAMLAVSALLLVLQNLFLDDIAHLLTQEKTLRPLVRDYLRVLVYGTPVIILPLGLVYCMRVDGKVKLASAVLIVANLVNLALDLVYMGPLGMGIAGSSLATVSGYVAGAFLLVPYALSSERSLGFSRALWAQPVAVVKHLKNILATGFPAALSSILITLKILAINTIVLQVAGKTGMVAFSVCLSCLSFTSMFISGAAQAMTPIVGVLYGEGDKQGVHFVVRRACQVLLVASVVAITLLETMPGTVLHLFGVRAAADYAEGIPAIRIFAISLIGTSFTFLAMFYYMTIGHRKLATAISIVQGVAVLIPAAYFLSRIMGVTGVWIAFSLAELATLLMIMAFYLRLKRREPDRYRDILLLDAGRLEQENVLEATSANTDDEAGDMLRNAAGFLKDLNLEDSTAAAVAKSLEELVANIVRHAYPDKKRGLMDLRVRVAEDKVVVSLRDDGVHFNPREYLDRQETAAQSDHTAIADSGLALVNRLAQDMDYSRTIGFNNTSITFQRGR